MSALSSRAARGVTYFELLTVLALLVLLAGAIVVPDYRAFAAHRAARHAASTLAEDLALLQRSAQNSTGARGSSLIIVSSDPLSYDCYRGRPPDVDPSATLGDLLIERVFPGVRLLGGPINPATPLLFASNGSAQYLAGHVVADQHQTIEFALAPSADPERVQTVELNLFTGSVSQP